MEIRQLRYFEAVSRHRHFTRAAEELHIAQSALSHQVRRLELELGVELLNRTTRSVEPTEAASWSPLARAGSSTKRTCCGARSMSCEDWCAGG